MLAVDSPEPVSLPELVVANEVVELWASGVDEWVLSLWSFRVESGLFEPCVPGR